MSGIQSPSLLNRTAESRNLYFFCKRVMGFRGREGVLSITVDTSGELDGLLKKSPIPVNVISGIGVSISHLDLCSVSRMVGLQGRSGGGLRLRPRNGGSEKEGGGTTASVMWDRSPRSGLGLRPKPRAQRHNTGQVGGGGDCTQGKSPCGS